MESKIKHLIKEANELLACPGDLVEMADLLILLLAITRMQNVTIEQLVEAAWAKHQINLARKWSLPDAEGICEHIRTEEAA